MPLDLVELAVQSRQRRDADHDVPPGPGQARQATDRRAVVVEVLDHIEGQDRVVGRIVGRQRPGQVGLDQPAAGPVKVLEESGYA